MWNHLSVLGISFLRKCNVVMNHLKLWLWDSRSVEIGKWFGKFDQGRISGWIIQESGPPKFLSTLVLKNIRLNIYIAQICWKIASSLLQLVCVETAYTCSLEGISSVEWLSECQHSSSSFLDDKS